MIPLLPFTTKFSTHESEVPGTKVTDHSMQVLLLQPSRVVAIAYVVGFLLLYVVFSFEKQ